MDEPPCARALDRHLSHGSLTVMSTQLVADAPELGDMPAWVINNRLAAYVPALREYDDEFRFRVVTSGFGTVWISGNSDEQKALVEEEPEPFEPFWDAFLAAWAEYLCKEEGLPPPAWVTKPERYLPTMRWGADYFPSERGRVVVTTPGVFEEHGIWVSDNDLLIV